ncbi:hypothetical protein ACFVAJ_19180 [Agromyces sp. NPDC057679]|uniref:hypothetical protein n=1 Tax=Agromyces sp. NPDC057679 TaxID=3346207 RepID=UPI00367292A7
MRTKTKTAVIAGAATLAVAAGAAAVAAKRSAPAPRVTTKWNDTEHGPRHVTPPKYNLEEIFASMIAIFAIGAFLFSLCWAYQGPHWEIVDNAKQHGVELTYFQAVSLTRTHRPIAVEVNGETIWLTTGINEEGHYELLVDGREELQAQ